MAREERPPIHANTNNSRERGMLIDKRTIADNWWEIQSIAQWVYLPAAMLQISNTMWWNDRGMDGPSKGEIYWEQV